MSTSTGSPVSPIASSRRFKLLAIALSTLLLALALCFVAPQALADDPPPEPDVPENAKSFGGFMYWDAGTGGIDAGLAWDSEGGVTLLYVGQSPTVTVPETVGGKKVVSCYVWGNLQDRDGKPAVTSVNTRKAIHLEYLSIWANGVQSLDLSKNTKLKSLNCWCSVDKLFVSSCPDLKFLSCPGNRLTQLNVYANTKLKTLICNDNQLETLSFPAKGNESMEFLNCAGNKLTSFWATRVPNLTDLYCDDNQLSALYVHKNTQLKYLTCSNNNLRVLALPDAPIQQLECSNNSLSKLYVSTLPELVNLRCDHNQLTQLNASKNAKLVSLWCSNNKISTLSLPANGKLSLLDCASNNLTKLYVSTLKSLLVLNFADNAVQGINLPRSNTVVGLTCKNNQLTKLDISGNKYLTSLNFSNNQVADVTVAQDQGKFLALDYSGNPLPDETKALLDSLRLLGAATTI